MQESKIYNVLLVLQIALFLLGRLLDNLSWHDLGVQNEVNVFEGIGIACLIVCVILQVLRKRKIYGIITLLFWKSQVKFFIAWSLQITLVILFFNVFGCQTHLVQSELAYFYVEYDGCILNSIQLLLTLLNYSLLCNTKADRAQFLVYQMVLFGEIIYNGHLLLLFINHLEGQPKDESILLISITIANLMLIMDLLFRAAFEEKEREQEKQQKMVQHLLKRDSIKEVDLNTILKT